MVKLVSIQATNLYMRCYVYIHSARETVINEQTELHPTIENFSLNLEILQSRVDSMQSLINLHDDLRLEQLIRILSDEVKKRKSGSRQASPTIDSVSIFETNNNVQVSTISENNGPQTKDINNLVSTIHLTKQSKGNTVVHIVYKIMNLRICKYQLQCNQIIQLSTKRL